MYLSIEHGKVENYRQYCQQSTQMAKSSIFSLQFPKPTLAYSPKQMEYL